MKAGVEVFLMLVIDVCMITLVSLPSLYSTLPAEGIIIN